MDKRRVLLVGDAQVAAMLKEYFGYNNIYEGESIKYCEDALMMLRRRPFDLVLLLSFNAPWRTWSSLSSPAWNIESSSAILFLKQLRALLQPPPVIVVSGSLRADVEASAFANGAFAFFHKPFKFADLDRLLALACAMPQPEAGG